jgi:hypothetical protein
MENLLKKDTKIAFYAVEKVNFLNVIIKKFLPKLLGIHSHQ